MEPREWEPIGMQDSEYAIKKLDSAPEPHPFDSPITTTVYIVSWSLWATYFNLRYRNLSSFSLRTNRSDWLSYLALLIEFLTLVPQILSALHMSLYIFFGTKGKYRASYRLDGDVGPSIDVAITCAGEKLDIIMDTVCGAATQDYPPHKFRVFVLDDAKSDALQNAITEYNQKYRRDVRYLARTKLPNENHYYKAGNLRFGLTTTSNFEGGSEYFASLDVDMIPEPDWLRRVVPHLLLDSKLALASPAQWHYNLPKRDLLGQAGPAAMEIFEPMHDNIGCSHCFGSGYIVRRTALDEIGGWPKVPVGEDIFCSYMLAGHGWGIAFIKEFVQYGLTAGSFESLMKQRMRWTNGDLLLLKGMGYFVPAWDPAPRRTVPQIASAIIKIIKTLTVWTDLISLILLPIIIWLASDSLHRGRAGDDDNRWKVLFLATILVDKMSYVLIYAKVGRQTESRFWSAPYSAVSLLISVLPNAVISFTATGTVLSRANERSLKLRQRLPDRLLTLPLLLYFLYTLLACTSFLYFLYVSLFSIGKSMQTPLWTGALLRLLECIFKVSVPLRYMANPPVVPERRDLMQQDELGVWRPKQKYELVRSRRWTWLDVFEGLTLLVNYGRAIL